jgi:hypothetical protein
MPSLQDTELGLSVTGVSLVKGSFRCAKVTGTTTQGLTDLSMN